MQPRFEMTKRYPILLLSLLTVTAAYSQNITGTVTDADSNEPLIGVNVVVDGTAIGTVTDVNGAYQLDVESTEGTSLRFSFIGFVPTTIILDGTTTIDVALAPNVEQLENVVVTALGVSRDRRSLGYSAQAVSGAALQEVPDVQFVNNLTGKVAGVQITGSSNGPSASSYVTIRGITSLSGDNQPLFIVDGVPIYNGLATAQIGNADTRGSATVDFGNAANLLNTFDAASINVLKGPTAAALYGSRASNGVILVTTKQGNSDGIGVSFSANTTAQTILRLPDYQNEYGFGGEGKYDYEGGSDYTSRGWSAFGENWGPALDEGFMTRQFNSNGQPVEMTSAPNNIRDFFDTGITQSYSLAVTGGNEDSDFRLSYTWNDEKGIVPTTNYNRNTFHANVGRDLGRVKVRATGTYITNTSGNLPSAGYDESSSVMYNWLWYPRQVEINDLQNYWKEDLQGIQQSNFEELWTNNPWFVATENTNAMDGRRFMGSLTASIDLIENLSLRLRTGGDYNDENREFRRAFSTKGTQNGFYRVDDVYASEVNHEALLQYVNYENDSPFGVEVSVGANQMNQETLLKVAEVPASSGLSVPGLYTLGNARGAIVNTQVSTSKRINSLFGMARVTWQDMVYLDVAGRNDWSSTLPASNNAYFYPSASVSVVLSEILDIPTESPISYARMRGSLAEVGGDTDPYRIRNVYTYDTFWGNLPAASEQDALANATLRPESITTFEVGADLRFFQNRLGLDVAYFDIKSRDQILAVPLEAATGYGSRVINAGEISTTGWEAIVTATPIRGDITWKTTLNLSSTLSTVESLADGIEKYQIVSDVFTGDGGQDLSLEAIVGEAYGQLVGLGFQRVEDTSSPYHGQIIHENGLPLMTNEKVSAGTFQPDLTFGWSNTIDFDRISVSMLWSGQLGGKIYSRSHALLNTGGTITNNDDPNLPLSTLDGRNRVAPLSYDANGNPVDFNWQELCGIFDGLYGGGRTVTSGCAAGETPGVIGPGVRLDANGNYVENDVSVSTRAYFYEYYGNGFNRDNIEAATYDATFLKLRELSVRYQLPASVAQRMKARAVSIGLVGRNLLLFTDVPSIDPETYSIRNGIFTPGFESTQLPSTRSFGFNLNVTM